MSRLFQPYRALGLITDDIPFSLSQMGTECFAVVSIGRAFQIFKCDKLTLSIVSPPLERRIQALCSQRGNTYTASGSTITDWVRAKPVRKMSAPTGNILQMCAFGEALVALGEDGTVNVWNLAGGDLHGSLPMPESFRSPTFVMQL